LIGIELPGTLTALTAEITTLGGTNVIVVLLISVLVCYLLGMVGMAFIPYIVLAVTVLPAVVTSTGLSLLGLHMFMMYFLLMGPLTPPRFALMPLLPQL
ncbi:unnamed protein product, partial [marine sediment metagenome]